MISVFLVIAIQLQMLADNDDIDYMAINDGLENAVELIVRENKHQLTDLL